MVAALPSIEPSTGGSATRATLRPSHPALRLDDSVTAVDTGLSVALVQAHLAMALLACVLLVVADDTLQSGAHVRVPGCPADRRRRAVTADAMTGTTRGWSPSSFCRRSAGVRYIMALRISCIAANM